MIKLLQNNEPVIAKKIHEVFQLSYAVEAELLGVQDFPPLRRPRENYLNSSNDFYGFVQLDELAGVKEVENTDQYIDINSLVVKPEFFRLGIGKNY